MKKAVLIISLSLILQNISAQIETIIWQQCLGTDEICNSPNAVESTSSGYIFGIHLCEDGPGITNYHDGADSWIVNEDSIGNILWERCYGGSKYDAPIKIIKVNDSVFYLLVNSSSTDGDLQNGRPGNFWIVKINDVGEILWESSYGGSVGGEEVRDALLMPDNGLLMMGRIYSTGGDVSTHYGSMDIWLCRIDSTGNILWEKTFGNQGRDNALKIKITADQTVLMIGCHEEPGGMIDCVDPNYQADVWIVEMDLHGNMLNHWCYGGKYWDQGYDITEVSDGYVFAATTRSSDGQVEGFHGIGGPHTPDDIWAVKIDFSGNIIWQKCLGGYSWEYPVYITETSDSGFIIVGNTNSHDGDVSGNHTTEWNELDIWVVKLSSDGQLVWEHSFGGLGTDRFWGTNSVLKKDDYNFVIGANTNYSSGDVTCDLFLYDETSSAWLFEIKDCNYYAPGCPSGLSGPDTLCSAAEPASSFSSFSTQWAKGYEWKFEPDNAGTISYNDTTAQITWNQQFEGAVNVFARSYNDCGYSAWSEAFITHVYTCMSIEENNLSGFFITAHPNPASQRTAFNYVLPESENEAAITITDLAGKTIEVLKVSGQQGLKPWDTRQIKGGVYFYTLKAKGFSKTGKLIIIDMN